MRQISIDLTTENVRQHTGKVLGFIGEHNATELLITIPQPMIEESDYVVVFFQSGPLTFRSRRIYPDSNTESAYRVGNCIHCLIGRYLTEESFLGLQVECYRSGDDGEPVLIGKTPFAARLMFKPSPKGYPGFSYDGSYEDVQRAVEQTHKHKKLAVLEKIDETLGGQLSFDGREVSGGGIRAYDNYSALPADAADGSIAYAENDEVPGAEDSVAAGTQYSVLRFKETPDITALDNIALVTNADANGGGPKSYTLDIVMERPENDEYLCFMQAMYVENMASVLMVTMLESDRVARAYTPGGRDVIPGYPSYVYNFIDGFNASLMTGAAEPLICPAGWYKLTERRINYRPEYGSLKYDTQTLVEPIAFDDTPLKSANMCCRISYDAGNDDGDFVNAAELSVMLTKLFTASSQQAREKGLYIRAEGDWRRFKSGDVPVVPDRMSLPENASEGDFAIVQNSSYIYSNTSGGWSNTGTTWDKVYINPYLNSLTRLYDVEISAAYGFFVTENDMYQFAPQGGVGFELITNIAENYVLFSISPGNWSANRNHYIYSWVEQTLSFSSGSALENSSGIEVPLAVGWNRVKIDYYSGEYTGTENITDAADLPSLEIDNSTSGSQYVFYFTQCTSEWFQDGFSQNFMNSIPYFQSDNAAGLWGYSEGAWRKLENNLIYRYTFEGDT